MVYNMYNVHLYMYIVLQYCHLHTPPIDIVNWCDSCNTPICGQCLIMRGEHKDHSFRMLTDIRTELQALAEQLQPQLLKFKCEI
jgi:hypothetical protein